MSDDQKKNVSKVIERLVDSYKGYKDAAEHAEQDRHVKLFTDLSDKRYLYAVKLKESLGADGTGIELEGSTMGDMHRWWMELKNKLGDDEELMEEIIHGESELIDRYRNSMEDVSNQNIKQVMQEQLKEIKSSLELIHAKEKAA